MREQHFFCFFISSSLLRRNSSFLFISFSSYARLAGSGS